VALVAEFSFLGFPFAVEAGVGVSISPMSFVGELLAFEINVIVFAATG